MNMKKFLSVLLLLALCVTALAACGGNKDPKDDKASGLDAAKDYLWTMYKDKAEVTASDYTVVAAVKVEGVTYTIDWSVEITAGPADSIQIVPGANNTVTVDVPDQASEEIVYTLKASLKDADGKSAELSFPHKVPAYAVNTWEDYVRECGEDDGDSVVIIGYVTAINAATDSSSKGTMWVQDATGHGYYVYGPVLTDVDLTSREAIQKAFPVGTQVEVSGTVTTYNGCFEFNKGCTVKKTGETAESKGVDLVYNDATEDFGKAADAKDRATLDKYQSARVSIKGATLTSIDGSYYYFTVNGVQYNLYKNNYFFEGDQIDELFSKFVVGTKADITGVVSVYSNLFQVYPDTVNAITPSDVELTPEEKVDVELNNATISATITSDTEITLPSKGASNQDVTFVWTVENENVTYDAATGLCTIKVPDVAVSVTFTVTASCGDVTKTKTIEVKLSKTATPIKDLIAIGESQTDYTTEMYIGCGIVTEVQNEKYGNLLIRDTEGTTILIYGLYTADGTRYDSMEQKPVAGDYITVVGSIGQYNGTAQFKNATLVSCVTPVTVAEAITIGDGFEKDTYTDSKYIVSGIIKEIQNEKYGNLLLTDGNGQDILVYGLYDWNGETRFDGMEKKPAVGDTITVYGILGKYNDPQMKNGWLVAVDAGNGGTETDTPDESDTTAPETPDESDTTAPETPDVPVPDASNPASIVDAAYALEAGTALADPYTLTGKVVSVDTAYSEQYKNVTVTIVVAGREDKPIQCFRMKGEGAETVAEGDTITVEGTLKNYNGTIEFDAGCALKSVTPAAEANTPAAIVDAAYALEAGTALEGTYTLTGKVVSVDAAYSEQYKNVTVTIAVAGKEDKPIQCFRMKGEGAENVAVGDTITVEGKLKNYNGTIEFDAGCTFTPAA